MILNPGLMLGIKHKSFYFTRLPIFATFTKCWGGGRSWTERTFWFADMAVLMRSKAIREACKRLKLYGFIPENVKPNCHYIISALQDNKAISIISTIITMIMGLPAVW